MATAKKPLQLKILNGSAKKNSGRVPEQEPQYVTPEEILPPPPDMDPIAKAQWEKIYPLIRESGVLKVTDLESFRNYCEWFAALKHSQSLVRSQGPVIETMNGETRKNPAFATMLESSKEVRAFEGLFGLNPSARGGLDVGKKKEQTFTSRRRRS